VCLLDNVAGVGHPTYVSETESKFKLLTGHFFGPVFRVLYSTTYTSGIQELMSEFHSSNIVVTLGVTTYLFGLAVGAVLSAPLGEVYGRKVVLVVGMFMFIVFLLPCNFMTAISQILVLRFLGGECQCVLFGFLLEKNVTTANQER
jgi:MFS family permease